MLRKSFLNLICVFGALMWAAAPAFSQALTSPPAPVVLSAKKPESLGITITTPGPVNFSLNGGTTPGSVVPAWTTNWNLNPQRTSLAVCVYLTGALIGTGTNPDTIPPANVLAQPNATGTFFALTGSACGQTNAVTVNTIAITESNRRNGSANDSAGLEINETTPPITLSPDTYSGTLNIIAQATP